MLLHVDGHEVRVTHPDKVFFTRRDETKLDLVEYYLAVGEPRMRTMGGRPVLLQRFPNGASGTSFFQKRVPTGAPDWLQTTVVSTPNGTTSQRHGGGRPRPRGVGGEHGCLGSHV